MAYIVKAGKEFEAQDLGKAAKEFAAVAHKYFVKNGWTFLNPGVDIFHPNVWYDDSTSHTPTEDELVLVLLGHWETHKTTQTSFGIAGGHLRLEPRPNSKFRFDVWDEAPKER